MKVKQLTMEALDRLIENTLLEYQNPKPKKHKLKVPTEQIKQHFDTNPYINVDLPEGYFVLTQTMLDEVIQQVVKEVQKRMG